MTASLSRKDRLIDLKLKAKIIDLPPAKKKFALRIIKEVKLNIEVRLDYLLDGLTDNVADALFEEMWALEKKDALQRQFNVMRALKLHSEVYRKEFCRLMDKNWVDYLRRDTEPSVVLPAGRAGIMIKSYRTRTESRHRVLITDVRSRFTHLTNSDFNDYPLFPEVLLISFWKSTEKLDLGSDERIMMLPLFQRFVMDRYGQLLAIANNTLIDYAIESDQDISFE